MNLTKCENGHYYDRDRFPVCPHCGMAPEQPFPDPDGPETEPHAMQIRKCPAGHFYNAGRYASCPLCKTEQPPKPKELPELLPEKYRKLGTIRLENRGASGLVYEIRGDRTYALKAVDCGRDPQKLDAAMREIQAMKRLNGAAGAVPLLEDFVLEDGDRTIVCLLEPYRTPLPVFLRRRALSTGGILRLGGALCRALISCRDAGVLHLDVQPKNIYLDEVDTVCLGDFGVVRFREEPEDLPRRCGTEAYMGPEVYAQGQCGEPAVLYSVGMILYALLNERVLPFMETLSAEEAARRRMQGSQLPPPRGLTAEERPVVEPLLEALCAFQASRRPQTLDAALQKITECLQVLEEQGLGTALHEEAPAAAGWFDADTTARSIPLFADDAGNITGTAPAETGLFEADPTAMSIPISADDRTGTPGTAPAGRELFAEDTFAPSDAFGIVPADTACDPTVPEKMEPQSMADIVSITWFCPCCGARNAPDAKFCVCCGARRSSASNGRAPTFSPAPVPVPAASAEPPARQKGGLLQSMLGLLRKDRKKPEPEQTPLTMDRVEFSAVAPKTLCKGDYSILHLMMYETAFRREVDALLEQADRPMRETKAGVLQVQRNKTIRVVLTSPDVEIADGEEQRVWQGGYLDFSFAVLLPAQYRKRQVLFQAQVYIDDVIATRLTFTADCVSPLEQRLQVLRQDVLSAFVSYASEDRAWVLTAVEGMKKVRADLDVFLDVESLRSGDNWESRLYAEIDRRDVLYLFWSRAARQSPWVDREWRYAMDQKGLEAIEPVPMEPPDICPPPKELESKHFNDSTLYIINAEKRRLKTGSSGK